METVPQAVLIPTVVEVKPQVLVVPAAWQVVEGPQTVAVEADGAHWPLSEAVVVGATHEPAVPVPTEQDWLATQTVAVGLPDGAHWPLAAAVMVGATHEPAPPAVTEQDWLAAQTVAVGLPDSAQAPLAVAVTVGVPQVDVV